MCSFSVFACQEELYIFLLSPLLLSVVCCWKDGYGELLSLSCLSKKERVQVNYDVV